jgi:hypothetical protein
MGVCKFKTSEIKRCVEHALKSTKWGMGWSDAKSQPAILFVHDQGIYCMSNGDPRDMVDEKSVFCAYAKGCDPSKDEEFYEEAQCLVGGDDFGETIAVNSDWLSNCDRFEEMHIRVNTKSMSITFKKPKKVAA